MKRFVGVWNTRTIVTVAIGAALFGVLMNYGGIPIFTNTSLTTAMIVPVVVGATCGPLPAAIAAGVGNFIADLIGGWGIYPAWAIANGVAALFIGALPLYGAYIDEGTMIDSHALVGSCAQIGKHVHLSAASQIGGVLEPVGALPVIIEDNVFIGGNCGIYEGTIVRENAVIGTGVIINSSTAIYDATTGEWIRRNGNGQIIVPAGAVVVAGSRPVTKGPGSQAGIHLYCPVIVKYKDDKTAGSTTLEDLLR